MFHFTCLNNVPIGILWSVITYRKVKLFWRNRSHDTLLLVCIFYGRRECVMHEALIVSKTDSWTDGIVSPRDNEYIRICSRYFIFKSSDISNLGQSQTIGHRFNYYGVYPHAYM